MGGMSTDPELIQPSFYSTRGTPIITSIQSTNYAELWSFSFKSAFLQLRNVVDLFVDVIGSERFAALIYSDSNPVVLMCTQSSGLILWSSSMTSISQNLPVSIATNSDFIWLVTQSFAGEWLSVSLRSNQAVMKAGLGTSGSANAIKLDGSYTNSPPTTKAYIGGYAVIGGNVYNIVMCFSISSPVSYAAVGVEFASSSNFMQITKMDYYLEYGALNHFILCVSEGREGNFFYYNSIGYHLLELDSTETIVNQWSSYFTFAYKEVKVVAISMYLTQYIYMLLNYERQNKFALAYFQTTNTQTASITFLPKMSQSSFNTMNAGFFPQQSSSAFYVGSTIQINGHFFPKSVAYLQTTYRSYLCFDPSPTSTVTQSISPMIHVMQGLPAFATLSVAVPDPSTVSASISEMALLVSTFQQQSWCVKEHVFLSGSDQSQTYYLYSPAVTSTFVFTPTYNCIDMISSCTSLDLGTGLAPTFISMTSSVSSSVPSCIASISSTTPADAYGSPYTIQITLTLPNSTITTAQLMLTIIDPCVSTPVFTAMPPAPTDGVYYLTQSTMSTVLPQFVSSFPLACGDILTLYTITPPDTSLVSPFTPNYPSLDLYTTDVLDIGTFVITYLGQFTPPTTTPYAIRQSYLTSVSIVVKSNLCDPLNFTSSAFSSLLQETYLFSFGGSYPINLAEIESHFDCLQSWSFQVTDLSTTLPFMYGSFSGFLLLIDASLPISIGTHTLLLTATLNGLYDYNAVFTVEIQKQRQAPLVPTFKSDLIDQYVELGKTANYILPSQESQPDGTATVTLNLHSSTLPYFCQYNIVTQTFKFSPLQESQLGQYLIEVELTDDSTSASQAYFFYLIVFKHVDDDSLDKQNGTSGQKNSSYSSKKYLKISENVNRSISMKIDSISNKGAVVVSFSEALNVRSDSDHFGIEDLTLYSYKPSGSKDDTQHVKSWKITAMSSDQMTIMVNWTKSIEISFQSDKDYLRIIILSNNYFKSETSNQCISQNYSMSKVIPPQMQSDSLTKSIESSAITSKNSMETAIVINLFFQVLMSVSLQLMWGMVNTLQIFVQMPLLSVSYPSNAQIFCQTVIQLVNFKIIPTEKIEEKVFLFKGQFDDALSEQLIIAGVTSTNIIKNMGNVLIGLIGLIILAIILVLVQKLINRFQFAKKIYLIVHRKVFFNSILRSFLQSYLLLSIATFIQIKSLKFTKDSGSIISSIIAIITFAYAVVFPVFISAFLNKQQLKLANLDFQGRFGSLYLNVRTDQPSARYLSAIFVTRRLIFSLSIVFLEGFPCFQIPIHIISSSLVLYYLVIAQPLNSLLFNRVEMFNELCLLIGSYLIIDFSDYEQSPRQKYQTGFVMAALMFINFIINWIVLLSKVFSLVVPIIGKKVQAIWVQLKLKNQVAEPNALVDAKVKNVLSLPEIQNQSLQIIDLSQNLEEEKVAVQEEQIHVRQTPLFRNKYNEIDFIPYSMGINQKLPKPLNQLQKLQIKQERQLFQPISLKPLEMASQNYYEQPSISDIMNNSMAQSDRNLQNGYLSQQMNRQFGQNEWIEAQEEQSNEAPQEEYLEVIEFENVDDFQAKIQKVLDENSINDDILGKIQTNMGSVLRTNDQYFNRKRNEFHQD